MRSFIAKSVTSLFYESRINSIGFSGVARNTFEFSNSAELIYKLKSIF